MPPSSGGASGTRASAAVCGSSPNGPCAAVEASGTTAALWAGLRAAAHTIARTMLARRDHLARAEAVMVATVEAAVPALTAARTWSTASTAWSVPARPRRLRPGSAMLPAACWHPSALPYPEAEGGPRRFMGSQRGPYQTTGDGHGLAFLHQLLNGCELDRVTAFS